MAAIGPGQSFNIKNLLLTVIWTPQEKNAIYFKCWNYKSFKIHKQPDSQSDESGGGIGNLSQTELHNINLVTFLFQIFPYHFL